LFNLIEFYIFKTSKIYVFPPTIDAEKSVQIICWLLKKYFNIFQFYI